MMTIRMLAAGTPQSAIPPEFRRFFGPMGRRARILRRRSSMASVAASSSLPTATS